MPSQTLRHFIADTREFFTNKKNNVYPESLEEPQQDDLSKSQYFFELGKVYNQKIEFWLAKMRKFSYAYALLAVLHLFKILFLDSVAGASREWTDLMQMDLAQDFVLSNYPLVGSVLDLVIVKGLIVLMSFTTCYQYYSKSNTENMRRLNIIYYATNVDVFFFMMHVIFFVWREVGRSRLASDALLMFTDPLFNSVTYASWLLTALFFVSIHTLVLY